MIFSRIIKRRWTIIIVWAIVLVSAILTMPGMGQLVRDKGQTSVGDNYSSSIAKTILNQMNNTTDNERQFNMILVYYNENKLTNENKKSIQEKIIALSNNMSQHQILSVNNIFENADLVDQYISKDGTTLLVPITLSKEHDTVSNIRTDIISEMKIDELELQATSSDLITEDFARTTEKGVQKTELITIVFIVIVLLIIFRSPVTPLINLATVGLTFMVSLNIVLQLVNYFNFPISNFSRVFLILILFGIGTDYTMLLLMRFKEELVCGADRSTAIVNTYKTAGKTVLFSSLTIFIGFTCLYFVQFNLFKSASAVAIGVAVLILVLYTFVPVIMMLLGKHLFWSPFKTKGHAQSRIWEGVSRFSTRFPYITSILCALICSTVLLYNGHLSYNNLSEVDPSYSSVVGYNLITEHFGSGQTAPATIALKSSQSMNNQNDMEQLDRLTEIIKSVDGVDTVYSVTQPKGAKIDELYLDSQLKTTTDGLTSALDGIDEIKDGLQSAVTQLQSASGNDGSLEQLQSGTNNLLTGISSLKNASGKVSTGLESLEKGTETLSSNLETLKTSCEKLENGLTSSASVSEQITKGIGSVHKSISSMQTMINQMSNSSNNLASSITTISTLLGDVKTNLSSIGTNVNVIGTNAGALSKQLNPSDSQYDTQMQEVENIITSTKNIGTSLTTITSKLTGVQTALSSFSSANTSQYISQAQAGLNKISSALSKLESASSQLNAGLINATDAQSKITSAVSQLSDGAKQMNDGLLKVADGQKAINEGLVNLYDGAKTLQTGQNELIDGVEKLTKESAKLTSGLNDAINGLGKVSNGLTSANEYLGGLSTFKDADSIFYIPEDKIDGEDFGKSLNRYMSKDHKITKITITLSVDPYSPQAMEIANNIQDKIDSYLSVSTLNISSWGISGTAQSNVELDNMSNSDFNFARTIMLIGIFIVLVIITHEIWMPIFITISLIASYYIAMTLSSIIFHQIIGFGDLSWNVPFCSFIMIVTLGVDYSIFLIMRQKENVGLSDMESIVLSCKKVGSVITSAALILMGTFAALYPSRVRTLMELSVTVVIGISLLCLVFIPVFIPTMIAIKSKLLELKRN